MKTARLIAGVKMPSPRGGRGHVGDFGQKLAKLEVDAGMVLAPKGWSQQRTASEAAKHGKRLGFKFATRRLVEGVGVWRIE